MDPKPGYSGQSNNGGKEWTFDLAADSYEKIRTGNSEEYVIREGVLKEYRGKSPVIAPPEGITEIGDNAFMHNDTVEWVLLPETVLRVGCRAFYGCGRLRGIVLPDSLETVGASAFAGCGRLEVISGKLPNLDKVEADALVGTKWLENRGGFILLGNVWVAYNDEDPGKRVIRAPEGIRSTADDVVFISWPPNAETLVLPSSVRRVGKRAFWDFLDDSDVSQIELGDGVRIIEDWAFYRSTSNAKEKKALTVTGGASVSSIGKEAFPASVRFSGCQSVLLKYIASGRVLPVPDSRTLLMPYDGRGDETDLCEWIDSPEFDKETVIETPWYSPMQAAAARNHIETHICMGPGQYYENKYSVPGNVGSLEEDLQKRDFSMVTELLIDAGYYQSEDGKSEFIGNELSEVACLCPSLMRFRLCGNSRKYTEIDGALFERIDFDAWHTLLFPIKNWKNSLVLVAFPAGRTGHWDVPDNTVRIGVEAFKNARISGISFPRCLDTIDEYSFVDCDRLEEIRIPAGVFLGFSGWETPVIGGRSLRKIRVDPRHEKYYTYERCLYREGGLICCPAGMEGSFKAPSFCESIGSGAFCRCEKLTEIDLSRMAEGSMICMRAFSGCSGLTSLTLPPAVSALAEFAFVDCENLKDLWIGNDEIRLNKWENPFACMERTVIHANAGSTTDQSAKRFKFMLSLRISGEKKIAPEAFINRDEIVETQMDGFTESIGRAAFMGCCSMTKAVIPPSVKDIARDAFLGCDRLTMYVSMGSYAHEYAMALGFPFKII